jgi:hypothetical protein
VPIQFISVRGLGSSESNDEPPHDALIEQLTTVDILRFGSDSLRRAVPEKSAWFSMGAALTGCRMQTSGVTYYYSFAQTGTDLRKANYDRGNNIDVSGALHFLPRDEDTEITLRELLDPSTKAGFATKVDPFYQLNCWTSRLV